MVPNSLKTSKEDCSDETELLLVAEWLLFIEVVGVVPFKWTWFEDDEDEEDTEEDDADIGNDIDDAKAIFEFLFCLFCDELVEVVVDVTVVVVTVVKVGAAELLKRLDQHLDDELVTGIDLLLCELLLTIDWVARLDIVSITVDIFSRLRLKLFVK